MHKQSERSSVELKPRFPRLQHMRRKLDEKRRLDWLDWILDASEFDLPGLVPSHPR